MVRGTHPHLYLRGWGGVIIIIIGGGGCPGDVGIMESNGSGPGTPTSGGVVVMVEYTKYSQFGTRILNSEIFSNIRKVKIYAKISIY